MRCFRSFSRHTRQLNKPVAALQRTGRSVLGVYVVHSIFY